MKIETEPADLSKLKIDWRDSPKAPGPRRRRLKAVWIGLVLLAVVAAAAYRFLAASPIAVEVATVVSINPNQPAVVLNASGYVVAQRRADVASKGTGRLVELRVKEGDRVKKGQILARLESDDMAAALARAQANLGVARSALEEARAELNEATLDYERKKNLVEAGMVSRAEFEAAEARWLRAQAGVVSATAGIRAAEAAVRTAEVDFENTIIRAPFDGTVLTKNADVGEVVAPFGSSTQAKAAVVTMADMESLQVEADVSESNLEKIHAGQRCEIILDAYPDTTYEGIVSAIVPTVDRAKATVLTKIRFQKLDARIIPEMSARVAFLSEPSAREGQKEVIAISPAAVVQRGERRVVFRIQEDRAHETLVELGGPAGGLIEIKSGLREGDRVVVNPPERLRDGDRTETVSK